MVENGLGAFAHTTQPESDMHKEAHNMDGEIVAAAARHAKSRNSMWPGT
jgi:hypothetical protein